MPTRGELTAQLQEALSNIPDRDACIYVIADWMSLSDLANLVAHQQKRFTYRSGILKKPQTKFLAGAVEDLEFSTRTARRLKAANIFTNADLVANSPEFYLNITGFGRRSLREIQEMVSSWGFKLGER